MSDNPSVLEHIGINQFLEVDEHCIIYLRGIIPEKLSNRLLNIFGGHPYTLHSFNSPFPPLNINLPSKTLLTKFACPFVLRALGQIISGKRKGAKMNFKGQCSGDVTRCKWVTANICKSWFCQLIYSERKNREAAIFLIPIIFIFVSYFTESW